MWVFHRRICVYPWRISKKLIFSLFTAEDFVKNQSFTPKELHIFIALPPKKSPIFITYPRRIPLVHNRGDAGIKINAIAHCHFISYLLLRDYNERDFILTSLLHRSYIIFDLWVIKVTFFNFFFKGEVTNFFLSWICRLLYFKATKRNGRSFVLNRWIQKNIKLHLWNICYRSNLISG